MPVRMPAVLMLSGTGPAPVVPPALRLPLFALLDSAPPPSVLSLPGAIAEVMNAADSLAFVVGGTTFGKASVSAADAGIYIDFFEIASGTRTLTGLGGFIKDITYQFDLYGPDGDTLERMDDALCDLFNPMSPAVDFRNGSVANARPRTGASDRDEYTSPDGTPLKRKHRDIQFTTARRSFPAS